ncbi:hypothetical protein AVEN_178602-1 [Araneus ventricosus]|uniref:Uncharacterized protein n=1 Tax=Araneus ventricosus TaxID=182803 RepID=A0A4Y2SA47_ARAVE|nr:hypothetical protein AVEN_178602-1 [Araneus ventricosus]
MGMEWTADECPALKGFVIFGFENESFGPGLVRIRNFTVRFRKISNEVTWARRRTPRQIFRGKNSTITEVNENRDKSSVEKIRR